MFITTSMLINEYQKWLVKWRTEGRQIWLGTLMFNEINLNKAGALAVIKGEMERVYVHLLTNISRHPRNRCVEDLPIMFGCPDSPVSKKYKPKARLADIAPNNGMHYHFMLGLPAVNRLSMSLDQHIEENQQAYCGKHGVVCTVHVKLIRDGGDDIADYVLKHIKRRTYSWDDILILPAFCNGGVKFLAETAH